MRVLVLGATGYIGSRLVPSLLQNGHEVVAASSSAPRPERFSWGHEVEWARCDVGDAASVTAAVTGAEAIVYLVHSLDRPGFTEIDRVGAGNVRAAADAVKVRRIVYFSGLVPDAPEEELSRHISSRLDVERILDQANASTLALRAGVVIGAGSTSFEVVRQIATLLLVQPIPPWMRSQVQPIAVTDVIRALVETVEDNRHTGSLDVGSQDVVAYPELLGVYAKAARLLRLRLPVPIAPMPIAALGSALMVTAPFWTVTSLVESLSHDMVCRMGHTWVPADGRSLVSLSEAMRRAAVDEPGRHLESSLPSDPDWTRTRTPVLDQLPVPATTRAGANLVLQRVRALREAPGRLLKRT